jgi:branched-chain amino acid transport system substrate-binding protein
MRSIKHLSIAGAIALIAVLSACSGGSGAPDSNPTTSGTPIKVGFLNQGSGAQALPDFGAGGTVGAQQINDDGGINGHPIDLSVCNTDGTPAASIKCANQFVTDGVVAVVQGLDLSSDSALEILSGAGIPLIGHTPFGTAQANSDDAWFFGAAPGVFYSAPLKALKDEYGIKSVAFLNVDAPVTRQVADLYLVPAAKALGLRLSLNFYSAPANYNSAFASAVADKPDAVLMIAAEPDCTAFIQSARTLGYKGKIFAGSCGQYVTADPAAAEGVLSDSDLYSTANTAGIPKTAAKQIEVYLKAMQGQPAANVDNFSQMSFSTMQDFATAARTIDGPVTSASLKKALKSVAGQEGYMGQTLTCDGKQWPDSISICAAGVLVYIVKDGKLTPLSGEFTSTADLYKN